MEFGHVDRVRRLKTRQTIRQDTDASGVKNGEKDKRNSHPKRSEFRILSKSTVDSNRLTHSVRHHTWPNATLVGFMVSGNAGTDCLDYHFYYRTLWSLFIYPETWRQQIYTREPTSQRAMNYLSFLYLHWPWSRLAFTRRSSRYLIRPVRKSRANDVLHQHALCFIVQPWSSCELQQRVQLNKFIHSASIHSR